MCQARERDSATSEPKSERELSDEESDSNDEIDAEENEEDEYDENTEIIRSKWSLDGAKTIDEIIQRYHDLIDHYTRLKAEGWELTGEIQDDYGFIRKTT